MTHSEVKQKHEVRVIVWKSGEYKILDSSESWEFENDSDWLVTIPIQFASEVSAEKEQELNRWRNAHHKITVQDVELRERIAELEAELERLNADKK